jgi:hypothetical protein
MIAKRRWFRCRALKFPGVFYCAYAALRFNRKAPNPVVSRGRNDKHKLILKKITHGAFRPLAKTFLAAHAEDFTTGLFWLYHLRFETMEHGGE